MNVYKKLGISFASFTFLFWLFFQPLSSIGLHRNYFDVPSEKHQIDQVELNDFLKVWSNMMSSSFKNTVKSASLKTGSSYPLSFLRWLKLQHWSVERFFYTEQQIRDMLKYAEIKTRLKDNNEIARKSHTNLNKMNKDLETRLEASPYSEEELDLIILNMYQITEVLSGRAILGETN